MPPVVTMSQLLKAGVHYGHRTHRWNPKMDTYIHGEQKGIYIIDLRQTLKALGEVYIFVRNLVADGKILLFVGTKPSIAENVRLYAEKCGMPYVNERWLGGTLTNFTTVSSQTAKLHEYKDMEDKGLYEMMPKKEALLYQREMSRLMRNLGGIRNMESVPDAVFILDTLKEHIALVEAQKLGIPTIAVVDTNCNPEEVDYVIPGNDDSILSGELMCRVICEAVLAGSKKREEFMALHPPSESEHLENGHKTDWQTEAEQPEYDEKLASEQSIKPEADKTQIEETPALTKTPAEADQVETETSQVEAEVKTDTEHSEADAATEQELTEPLDAEPLDEPG